MATIAAVLILNGCGGADNNTEDGSTSADASAKASLSQISPSSNRGSVAHTSQELPNCR
jgi:hypothetical protein